MFDFRHQCQILDTIVRVFFLLLLRPFVCLLCQAVPWVKRKYSSIEVDLVFLFWAYALNYSNSG